MTYMAYTTVKSKLMAIRQGHLLAGCGDPLVGKERVWLALEIKGAEYITCLVEDADYSTPNSQT